MGEALGAEVGFAEAVPGVVAEGVGLGGVGEDAAVELAVAVGVEVGGDDVGSGGAVAKL